MSKEVNPVILCILDGWGYSPKKDFNAIKLANTPAWDELVESSLHTFIRTDGEYVGLPEGQMGNSEVGHTSIGSGRIVYQDLPKISKAFNKNEVSNNPNIQKAISIAKTNNGTIHVMGLCSNGGIHSHIDHLIESSKIFAKSGIKVALHLFTDGRDSPPESSIKFMEQVKNFINKYNNVSIATVCGRYYAMDRDKRWERIELAYNAIVLGEGNHFPSVEEAISQAYKELNAENRIASDEFIKPSVISNYSGINDSDIIFMVNFRADRARELLTSLLDPNFLGFNRKKVINFSYALGMVNYSKELDNFLDTVFPTEDLENTLGEVISDNGLKQIRAAETEKYPHVTFFFNGGKETPFPGEERILVPSPKVATYDLQPEMSAYILKDKLLEVIKTQQYSLIVVNFANGDMVGHTGVLKATIKAVESVDTCLAELKKSAIENNYTMVITSDHGNSETMLDEKCRVPYTQHTTNPVRLIIYNPPKSKNITSLKEGNLSDVAPTILDIMNIVKPLSMTGTSLLKT